ncbi:hypothetical protein QIT29_gp20 [Metallosphaera rod-shaped virus 1]|uniref:Uncharacterized protein n=1 Tax=Metallosphaera rod-shaped virus 1 TaxID=2730618 RepID=A0A6M3VXW7_9VIRU|nr:hypothetical protein QIT29_gp20 [Metallosphaera rod-shaped virus 1]QJF12366.1 hypothetical protein MRV1_gp20 [Metallosphaera rod-shaped virus 1]
MSANPSGPHGKKVSARVIRALFVGSTIGIFGGFGLYLLADAINTLAHATIVSPTGFLLLGFGGSIAGVVGTELSKDLEE